MKASIVATILVASTVPFLGQVHPVGVAVAETPCPPEGAPTLTVTDSFDSRGMFTYQGGIDNPDFRPVVDGVLLSGRMLVCREEISPQAIMMCMFQGFSTATAIRTQAMALDLGGTTDLQIPLNIHLSSTTPSTGLVGNPMLGIPLRCDLHNHRITFVQDVDSFFDITYRIDFSGQPAPVQGQVHVVNRIGCLPPGPEGIPPCPVPPYQHVGGPMAFLQTIAAGMQANSACHLPFFVPAPPPAGCGAAGPRNDKGWVTDSFFDIFASDVSARTTLNVMTKSVTAPASVTVTVGPWADPDGNGVWRAKVGVVPNPTLLPPMCGSGETIPIEIVALSLVSSSPIPVQYDTPIHVDWCMRP